MSETNPAPKKLATILAVLSYLDARMSEPSTWIVIGGALTAANINCTTAQWQIITEWGIGICGLLGILLKEGATMPPANVASDALLYLIKNVLPLLPKPAEPPATGTSNTGTSLTTTASAVVVMLAAALGLSACATTPSPAAFAADAQLILSGLQTVEPALASISGIQPATLAQFQTDLTNAEAAATGLSAVTAGQAVPTSLTTGLETALNDALTVATTPPLSTIVPSQVEVVLVAAKALSLTIETVASGTSAAVAPSIPPDAARLILKGATATK